MCVQINTVHRCTPQVGIQDTRYKMVAWGVDLEILFTKSTTCVTKKSNVFPLTINYTGLTKVCVGRVSNRLCVQLISDMLYILHVHDIHMTCMYDTCVHVLSFI